MRDPDGGIHQARKKARLGVLEVVEPDVKTCFPNEGFSENLEGLPEVNFKTIWTYMVACLDAKKQLSTAKPLVKGYNFYMSGHVLTVKSCKKDQRAFIKSQVLPSMKKTAAYTCYIILRRQGLVQRAFCGCPAGVDGRCNHVAATLFAMEVFCKSRAETETTTACTSQPCKWNIPRKRKGDVVPVSQMKFCKHEYGKNKTERSPQIVQDQDFRAPYQRITSNTKLYNIFSKVKDFEKKTGKVPGLSHVLQQKTPEQNKVDMCHDHSYCGLLPQCNELNSPVNTKDRDELISPIKEHPVSMEEICARCEKVKKALFVTDEEVKRIESETRNQSADQQWFTHRKFRITASKAYRCAALKQDTSPTKALREVLQYNTSFTSEAMQAGIQQEPEIIKNYLAQQAQNGHNDITVDKCGFFVSKTHPFLGASPDGIVSDSESSGLLEVKYIQMEESETLEEALIRKRICVKISGILEIHKKHQYYFQLQQQMFVANKVWNDFVVKGSGGTSVFIQRVFFDSSFWNTVLHKLEFFFQTYMLPEIAYPKVKYGQERLATASQNGNGCKQERQT